jgi:hypothetical protein
MKRLSILIQVKFPAYLKQSIVSQRGLIVKAKFLFAGCNLFFFGNDDPELIRNFFQSVYKNEGLESLLDLTVAVIVFGS